MSRKNQADGLEAVLQQTDATLEDWVKWAKKERKQAQTAVQKAAHDALVRGAGALRKQVDDLQRGLKKLSGGLEQLERGGRPAATSTPSKRRPRRATAKKSTGVRKLKKAA